MSGKKNEDMSKMGVKNAKKAIEKKASPSNANATVGEALASARKPAANEPPPTKQPNVGYKWVVRQCYVKATLDGKVIEPVEAYGLACIGANLPQSVGAVGGGKVQTTLAMHRKSGMHPDLLPVRSNTIVINDDEGAVIDA